MGIRIGWSKEGDEEDTCGRVGLEEEGGSHMGLLYEYG